MSYVFQFDQDEENFVWVTTQEFWNAHGHFDDQERGEGFPPNVDQVLINAAEAFFEWVQKRYDRQSIRSLLTGHGWTELP